jgi:hypothetical protein
MFQLDQLVVLSLYTGRNQCLGSVQEVQEGCARCGDYWYDQRGQPIGHNLGSIAIASLRDIGYLNQTRRFPTPPVDLQVESNTTQQRHGWLPKAHQKRLTQFNHKRQTGR